MMGQIGNKSNKASVATALHRKSNKKEIDETTDKLNEDIKKLEELMEAQKVDSKEHCDKLKTLFETKLAETEAKYTEGETRLESDF